MTNPKTEIRSDGTDISIVADGVTIAKRGRPGTPEAGTWVILVPGWEVRGVAQLEITYHGKPVH